MKLRSEWRSGKEIRFHLLFSSATIPLSESSNITNQRVASPLEHRK